MIDPFATSYNSTNNCIIPKELLADFTINPDGKAFCSRRATARLANVSDTAIRKLLENLAANLNVPESIETFAGQSFEGANLPDILVACILEYYAYEAQERYRTKQAKKYCRAFRANGIRAWIQNQLNWQPPTSPKNTTEENTPKALKAAQYSKEIYDCLGKINPKLAQFLIDSCISEVMKAQYPLLSEISQPTLLGVVEIAEKLGYKVKLNQRSNLGKFVKQRCAYLAKEEKRLCNGQIRPIACYPEGKKNVEDAVKAFFN